MKAPAKVTFALVAAWCLLPENARAFDLPCQDDLIRVHELIGSAPGGEAWAVRQVTVPRPAGADEESPCPGKGPYPKIKDWQNHGTVLLLCRAGARECESFAIYQPVGCGEPAKTTEAAASASLAAAKQAFAAARIDLARPGRRLDDKGAALPESATSAHGIPGPVSARADQSEVVVEGAGLGRAGLDTGPSSVEEVYQPRLWLAADGSLLFWAFADQTCGNEWRVAGAPMKTVAARLLEERGARRYLKKDYAGAAEDFAAAWEREPARSELGIALGYARLLAGKKDEAGATLQKALAADPAAGLGPR